MSDQQVKDLQRVERLLHASRLLKELFAKHGIEFEATADGSAEAQTQAVSAGDVKLIFQLCQQRGQTHLNLELDLNPGSAQHVQLSLMYPLPDWGGWCLRAKDTPGRLQLLQQLGEEYTAICYVRGMDYELLQKQVIELVGQKDHRNARSKFFLRLAERMIRYFAKARDALKSAETAA